MKIVSLITACVALLAAIEFWPRGPMEGGHSYAVWERDGQTVVGGKVHWTDWEDGQRLLFVRVRDGEIESVYLYTVQRVGNAYAAADQVDLSPAEVEAIFGVRPLPVPSNRVATQE